MGGEEGGRGGGGGSSEAARASLEGIRVGSLTVQMERGVTDDEAMGTEGTALKGVVAGGRRVTEQQKPWRVPITAGQGVGRRRHGARATGFKVST